MPYVREWEPLSSALKRLKAAAARAHERTIASLPEQEKIFFLEALTRLIDSRDDPQEMMVSREDKN